MGLNAKNVKVDRPQQEVLEADVYRARLVQVIDLGLQPQKPYQGKEKPPVQEVMFTYELCDEFMKDEDGNEIKDKPRWVSETLPFYGLFADKAKSTQRYNAFDPTGACDGDVSRCIGVPINLTIVNNVVGDKTYNNVGNVASMAAKKAATCPDLVNPSKVLDLDAPNMEVFNALPEWLREKIKSNLNFQGSVLQQKLGNAPAVANRPTAQQSAQPAAKAEEKSNNPY